MIAHQSSNPSRQSRKPRVQRRRRPTVSLSVMLVLGLLWCGLLALAGQGDTPWQPADRGFFAAVCVQFVVISALLVFLWSKRARALVIMTTPIAIQVLANVLASARNVRDPETYEAHPTFVQGFLEIFPDMIAATVVITALIGAAVFALQRRRRSAEPATA